MIVKMNRRNFRVSVIFLENRQKLIFVLFHVFKNKGNWCFTRIPAILGDKNWIKLDATHLIITNLVLEIQVNTVEKTRFFANFLRLSAAGDFVGGNKIVLIYLITIYGLEKKTKTLVVYTKTWW